MIMKYFILLIILLSSSCDIDNVNTGWVIYNLEPLNDGRVLYKGEDNGITCVRGTKYIKFIGRQGEYNIGDSIKIVKVK